MGNHLYHYFQILLILVQIAESPKTFQVQNYMVSGNKHQSNQKIGFRLISSFIIDWPASKILISFYKTNFVSFIVHHYGFSKKFKILKFNLSLQEISELQVKYRKSFWDSKIPPSCLKPLVLLIFNLPCQLWGVITFEQIISLCWNFQNNLISHMPFIWKSFIKTWDGSF